MFEEQATSFPLSRKARLQRAGTHPRQFNEPFSLFLVILRELATEGPASHQKLSGRSGNCVNDWFQSVAARFAEMPLQMISQLLRLAPLAQDDKKSQFLLLT